MSAMILAFIPLLAVSGFFLVVVVLADCFPSHDDEESE